MTNKVLYVSKGGNTEKLARAIAKGANVKAEAITPDIKLENIDTLFLGGSIYAGKVDGKVSDFLKQMTADQVKRVVVFGTAAGKKTALAEVKTLCEEKNIKVCDEEFFCKGSFLFINLGCPSRDSLKQAEIFAANMLKR